MEKQQYNVMNRRGLKALARELLKALRPGVAAHLKRQCGAYLRDVGKSSILAEWASIAEQCADEGQSNFEVGNFYARKATPILIWIEPEWFDIREMD